MELLPPVDATHCDISAILLELQGLRLEVRDMGQMKDEIHALKVELEELKSTVAEYRTQAGECPGFRVPEWPNHNHNNSTASLDDFPPLTAVTSVQSAGALPPPHVNTTSKTTSQDYGKKPTKKVIIGASSSNQLVKSASTTRCVDIFISRLHPQTSGNEMVDCANEIAAMTGIKVDVQASKLKSKYESLYSSFYVSIRVASVNFKTAIDLFMSAEAWPSGVLVKRYFKPKNG